jgi:hypothetical protein
VTARIPPVLKSTEIAQHLDQALLQRLELRTARIPSVLKSTEIAQHLDQALLQRLEVRRFDNGLKRRPRGKKVPAGESYSSKQTKIIAVSRKQRVATMGQS